MPLLRIEQHLQWFLLLWQKFTTHYVIKAIATHRLYRAVELGYFRLCRTSNSGGLSSTWTVIPDTWTCTYVFSDLTRKYTLGDKAWVCNTL